MGVEKRACKIPNKSCCQASDFLPNLSSPCLFPSFPVFFLFSLFPFLGGVSSTPKFAVDGVGGRGDIRSLSLSVPALEDVTVDEGRVYGADLASYAFWALT